MKKIQWMIGLLSALAVGGLGSTPALAHEGHALDPELLASKIRERAYECTRVVEARETSAKPTVLAVKCSDDKAYKLVITESGFEVTPSPAPSPAGAPKTSDSSQ